MSWLRKGAARKPFGIVAGCRPRRSVGASRKRGFGRQAGMVFQNVLSRPRDMEGRGREERMRNARHRVEGGLEIVAKARQSGFGLNVELAAGGRGAEARKGIAPDPGDRNAKPGPFAVWVEQPPNRKVRVFSSGSSRSDRGEATGGRQQCRPPFRCARPGSSPCRAANRELLCFGAHVP